VILFTIIATLLTILAITHSESVAVASQNNLMESILREQASIIEGQRLYSEMLLDDIRKLSENQVLQRSDGSWR
jgi:hypothetical protein